MSENDTLQRFGVSMPKQLMEGFDKLIAEHGYYNRSEAIRDLVRKALLEKNVYEPHQIVAGTIGMIYDHHSSDLPAYLTDIQHDFHADIVSTVHVHLSHHQCLEILIVKGPFERLNKIHKMIQVQKGVFYAELAVYVCE